MTQEEKELLLVDLCARLPYNCRVFYEYIDDLDGKTYGYSITLNTWCIDEFVANKAVIKPYLRPMSSMTNDEIAEFKWLNDQCDTMPTFEYVPVENYRIYDWMNRHHLDYRGLIPIGLAIEVTEENNPYKK